MQYARKLDVPPEIEDEEDFAARWQLWWNDLQPAWRVSSANGALRRDGNGPWDSLAVPGTNGMFLVLISLSWWRTIALATRATLEQCDECTRDVLWVLQKMAVARSTPIAIGYVLYMRIYSTATVLMSYSSKHAMVPTPAEKPAKRAGPKQATNPTKRARRA